MARKASKGFKVAPGAEPADVYSRITDRIVSALEAGTVPWRRTWTADAPALGEHCSVHGHTYTGINALMTAIVAVEKGYKSQEWVTFQQAITLGGAVRRGEKGTTLILWKTATRENDDGSEDRYGFARSYTVFNVEQCDGLDDRKAKAEPDAPKAEPIAACEAVLAGFDACPSVQHGGSRACYSPGHDRVSMPAPEAFDSPAAYYATLFHELVHSTGHKSRLDRKPISEGGIVFGDHAYSKEELVAEMGAAFLSAETGIEAETIDNSASYIAGWLRALKDDRKLVVQAASAAQKAANWIRGRKATEQKAA